MVFILPRLSEAKDSAVVAMPLRDAATEMLLLALNGTDGVIGSRAEPVVRSLVASGVGVVLSVDAGVAPILSDRLVDLAAGLIIRHSGANQVGVWAQTLELLPAMHDVALLMLAGDDLPQFADPELVDDLLMMLRTAAADAIGVGWRSSRSSAPSLVALKPRVLSSMAWHGLLRSAEMDRIAAQSLIDVSDLVERLAAAGLNVGTLLVGEDGVATALPFDRPDTFVRGPTKVALFVRQGASEPLDRFAHRLLASCRRIGVDVNVSPVPGFSRNRGVDRVHWSSADSYGDPDIAILLVEPRDWNMLTSAQWQAWRAAGRKVGCFGAADLAGIDSDPAGRFDEVWHVGDVQLRGGLDVAHAALPFDIGASVENDPLTTRRVDDWLTERIDSILHRPPGLSPLPPVPLRTEEGVRVETRRLRGGLRIIALDWRGRATTSWSLRAKAYNVRLALFGRAVEWIVLAPARSILCPAVSDTLRRAACARPDVAIFYADDVCGRAEHLVDQCRYKPDLDLTLLATQDYIGSPVFVRATAWRELDGLRAGAGSAVVPDLIFRANERGMAVAGIAEVLLVHPGARPQATADDLKLVVEQLPDWSGWQIGPGPVPGSLGLLPPSPRLGEHVTVVVPTARAPDPAGGTRVERLLAAIAEVHWPAARMSVIVGDDGEDVPSWATRSWPFHLRRVATPRPPGTPFNYAAKMNALWRLAASEYLVFLNDDVVPLDREWLVVLQAHAARKGVAGVGATLFFEDGRLQHVGLVPHGEGAAHAWIGRRSLAGTYQDWALLQREWSMVTGAVFATRRSLMEQVGGFDERFALEFNDTDLCLRLRERGLRIVTAPAARFVHAERASRGDALPRGSEVALFIRRWRDWLDTDPSWHPRLDRTALEVRPTLPYRGWFVADDD